MTRMIILLSIAVTLFAVAAGTSWYLQQQQQHTAEDTAKSGEEKPGKRERPGSATKPIVAEPLPNRSLPRMPISPDAERLTKMAAALQQREDALNGREAQLRDRGKQVDLIHDHIKSEHKKLEAVRKEINVALQAVEEKLALLEARASVVDKSRKEIDARMDEFQQKVTSIKSSETKNIKQTASIYEKMEPDAGAANIQQLVEKGELDHAVAIVAAMRERQAAALLTELQNREASTAAQIVTRLRFYKSNDSVAK